MLLFWLFWLFVVNFRYQKSPYLAKKVLHNSRLDLYYSHILVLLRLFLLRDF